MNIIQWGILAHRDVACNISTRAKRLLPLFLAVIIFLPPFTFQMLPSFADVKNKKISYKEIRQRKHGKNKSNLKNQVINCTGIDT